MSLVEKFAVNVFEPALSLGLAFQTNLTLSLSPRFSEMVIIEQCNPLQLQKSSFRWQITHIYESPDCKYLRGEKRQENSLSETNSLKKDIPVTNYDLINKRCATAH